MPVAEAGPIDRLYPYLLRDLTFSRPNHVWAADITYIPMRRGFVYLFAVLNWASRRAITLTTDFCLDAVQDAVGRYGLPSIFNPDQGCQFTSQEFTGLLTHHGIQISMDGKGCWRNNMFVERLWGSIKCEEVYVHAYDTVNTAHQGLERYGTFYNQSRPHQALDGQTPSQVYYENLTTWLTAAQSATREAPLKNGNRLSNQPEPHLMGLKMAQPDHLGVTCSSLVVRILTEKICCAQHSAQVA